MFGIFHQNIKSKIFLDTNFRCFASQKIQARIYSTAMTGNMELHSFPCVCVRACTLIVYPMPLLKVFCTILYILGMSFLCLYSFIGSLSCRLVLGSVSVWSALCWILYSFQQYTLPFGIKGYRLSTLLQIESYCFSLVVWHQTCRDLTWAKCQIQTRWRCTCNDSYVILLNLFSLIC